MSSVKMIQNGEEVLRKGPWMPEEDEILIEYVRQYGPRDWSSIRAKGLLPRTGKSCRLRWVNKLKPDLKRSGCKFSPEEEKLVVEMQAKLGNKWAKIASCLPGRTDNDVKNFWSTRQKRLQRALQRPKGSNNGNEEATIFGKDSPFGEFSTFEVQSPIDDNLLMSSSFGGPLYFGEDNNMFREAYLSELPVPQDDVFNIKLPEISGDLYIPHLEGNDFKPDVSSQAQPRIKSGKRKSRSKKDTKTNSVQPTTTNEGAEPLPLPDLGSSLLPSSNLDFDVNFLEAASTSPIDLDMLIQPGEPLMQDNTILSQDLLLGNQRWEKLPVLCSSDMDCNLHLDEQVKKEIDSCSPDSVLANFPTDVFDCLEPLCTAPSEW